MKVHELRTPREVTEALTKSLITNDDIEYRAQDFWVYFGNNLINNGLLFYPQIFPNANAINTGILRASNGQQTLASAYWAWAKNQAYEKSSDRTLLHPQFIDASCAIEQRTARDAVLNPITFNFDSGKYTDSPSIPALTSKVYNFTFRNTKNRTLAVRFTGSAKFKWYMRSDEPNCPGGTDGTPATWKLFPNRQDSNTLVVIVSNTGSGSGTLELEVRAPQIRNEAPTPITFKANTSGGLEKNLTFTNPGKANLNYTLIFEKTNPTDPDWLQYPKQSAQLAPAVDPDTNATNPPAALNLTANCNGIWGKFSGTLFINHNDPTRADTNGNPVPAQIPVSLDCPVGTNWSYFIPTNSYACVYQPIGITNPINLLQDPGWWTQETVYYSTKQVGWNNIWIQSVQSYQQTPCLQPDPRDVVAAYVFGANVSSGEWRRPEDVGAVWGEGSPLVADWVWVDKP